MSQEVELKLALPPRAAASPTDVVWLQGIDSERKRLGNTYFDTPQGALQAAKVALRIRRTPTGYVQTLKTAGDANTGLTVRGEWEWPIEGETLDLDNLASLPPFQTFGTDVLEALEPRFTTDFERTTWLLEDEKGRIELAWDNGEIRAAGRRLPIHEIELELKEGHPDSLWSSADHLVHAVTLRPASTSKAARGTSLLTNDWTLPPCPDHPAGQFSCAIAALDAATDSGQTGFQTQAQAILSRLAERDDDAMTATIRRLSASLAEALKKTPWLTRESGQTALALSRAIYDIQR
ncbi:CYTH domain-containing protein [Aidingimonas lacisalsi]|uniref:CYTH domain-containing protein n=1 Tax=Aidingimonas lacisalsi TaxID=2604086 RepID=UPI0011D1E446|nr:CYTH domain-containing protein [Aidingimonas lacisalsi]